MNFIKKLFRFDGSQNKLRSFAAMALVGFLPWGYVPFSGDMSDSFNEKRLREQIKYLSSDELEGRGPGGKGGQMAAQYIADQLKASGLQGMGPGGSYFQQVKLFGVKSDPSTTLAISSKDKTEAFKFADEFVAFTGAQKADVDVDSELVFAGFGIDAPKYRWNDYKGSANDFKNKVLLIMVNDPPAPKEEPDLFTGQALTYYGRWSYKFEEAARRGAAGVILIHTDESAGYPWSVVRTSNGNWRYDVARNAKDKKPFLKMRSWVTRDSANRIVNLAGKDLLELQKSATKRDFKPVNLGLRVKVNIKSETKEFDSPNVVASLPGTDPKLRDEYVIYTSHWDHLGIGEPDKNGDKIYNGAADNASGVACVLAIADVMAKMSAMKRSKRSSLFLFTTAEEQGLLGADYYSQNPLVPLAKTAANINIDVVNMYDKVMDFTPLGAERSTLINVAKQVADERGLTITPDQRPEQGYFYRSDHFPFAKVGVPCVSLVYGKNFPNKPASFGEEIFREYNTQRYHQPSDEYSDSWNMNGIVQEGEIALAMGLIIGKAAEMPRYNVNDEFAIKRR